MASVPAREETKTIKITITPAARRPNQPHPRKGGSKLGRSFGYVVVVGCFAWLAWTVLTS